MINENCNYFTEEHLHTLKMSFLKYILNIIEYFTKITQPQDSITTNMRVSFMKDIHNWIIKNVIENRKFEICV